MLHKLTKQEFLDLAKSAKRVAAYQEIWADRFTPISIFEALSTKTNQAAILESGMQIPGVGHYSFIAIDPLARLLSNGDQVEQTIGNETTTFIGNPFDALRQLLVTLSCTTKAEMLHFIGNAVGYISYDAVRWFEKIPDRHAHDKDTPEILFNFYRTTLIFDHQEEKLLISMLVDISDQPEKDYEKVQKDIALLITKMNDAVTNQAHTSVESKNTISNIEVDMSDDEFIQLVNRTKKFIEKGDAFQVVISRNFKQPYTVDPFNIYRSLRRISPAPYMFYFPFSGGVIVGASPERMITVNAGKISLNPIAGTRKHTEQSNNEEIEKDLLNDEKELAEHMMLVDLARNDVGAVSEPGSVKVEELLQVKHYSHVSHITSMVTGKLRKGLDAFDAFRAAFPAGTLSGAPKIRAMEIIDELENSRREIYGGAICRLDYHGNLDSCIAIRMAILKEGMATVRAGAGIVFDSNPLSEAQETLNKAKSMLDAISLAHEE